MSENLYLIEVHSHKGMEWYCLVRAGNIEEARSKACIKYPTVEDLIGAEYPELEFRLDEDGVSNLVKIGW